MNVQQRAAPKGRGPLVGVRILEMGALGPVPFAGMLLADMGADVVRVDRLSDLTTATGPHVVPWDKDVVFRGRRSIAVDLKNEAGVETVLRLIENVDGLIEGFRPGVMERLGLGPEVCEAVNGALVYGRMTGWGQNGPLAQRPGHDINYVALAGALAHFGREGAPIAPLNIMGDLAGGGMFLAYGLVCALLESRNSGRGQVVDAAMTDGVAVLMALFHGKLADGSFDADRRGVNVIDGDAPWYDVYACADGRYVSVGAVEPKFYAELRHLLGLDGDPVFADPNDRSSWPGARLRLERLFSTRSSAEWDALLRDHDVCVAPVRTIADAAEHPHNAARGVFVEAYGVRQPRPAPRLSRTDGLVDRQPPRPGQHTAEVLAEWAGLSSTKVASLSSKKAIQQA